MTDRIAITPHQAAEYEVLLEFYDAWEMFHAIPKGRMNSRQGDALAKDLMDKVKILRRFRNPVVIQ